MAFGQLPANLQVGSSGWYDYIHEELKNPSYTGGAITGDYTDTFYGHTPNQAYGEGATVDNSAYSENGVRYTAGSSNESGASSGPQYEIDPNGRLAQLGIKYTGLNPTIQQDAQGTYRSNVNYGAMPKTVFGTAPNEVALLSGNFRQGKVYDPSLVKWDPNYGWITPAKNINPDFEQNWFDKFNDKYLGPTLMAALTMGAGAIGGAGLGTATSIMRGAQGALTGNPYALINAAIGGLGGSGILPTDMANFINNPLTKGVISQGTSYLRNGTIDPVALAIAAAGGTGLIDPSTARLLNIGAGAVQPFLPNGGRIGGGDQTPTPATTNSTTTSTVNPAAVANNTQGNSNMADIDWTAIVNNALGAVGGGPGGFNSAQFIPALMTAYNQYQDAGRYEQAGQNAANRASPVTTADRQRANSIYQQYQTNPQAFLDSNPVFQGALKTGLTETEKRMNTMGYGGSGILLRELNEQGNQLAGNFIDKELQRLRLDAGYQFDPANAARMEMEGTAQSIQARNMALAAISSLMGSAGANPAGSPAGAATNWGNVLGQLTGGQGLTAQNAVATVQRLAQLGASAQQIGQLIAKAPQEVWNLLALGNTQGQGPGLAETNPPPPGSSGDQGSQEPIVPDPSLGGGGGAQEPTIPPAEEFTPDYQNISLPDLDDIFTGD